MRDSDSMLPLILASLALLVALGIAGTALVHQRSVRPGEASAGARRDSDTACPGTPSAPARS